MEPQTCTLVAKGEAIFGRKILKFQPTHQHTVEQKIKTPVGLGYVTDYTTQFYRDYIKPYKDPY